ncbi:hypothetical protein [Halomonas cerina]|uniref:Uncharacterized protein n=1 Tax=Halomonas cerina TaxID=447424 RepID=A0A839V5I2_9GAMM|nr:hypothetical protein [Halomonas cerina]MBB3188829.1 hypothetical protein [Halomonas cerina]
MITFKKAPLALAITALMATPYALADGVNNGLIGSYNKFDTDSTIDSDFDNRIDVELRHDSDTYKDFYVNVWTFDPARHYSGATVDSKQLINYTGVSNRMAENNATLSDHALQGASGNVGVNVAAGDSNSQANDAALSASDAERVFGQAAAFSAQSSSNTYVESTGSPNNATLDRHALRGATGNIGVNVAAGVGNAQQNSLAASSNTRSGSADATTGGVQTAYNNFSRSQGHTETFTNRVGVRVSGVMVGGYLGGGSGGYAGTWEQTNQVYPEIWLGGSEASGHPGGSTYVGHLDFDGNSANTDQFAGTERGRLGFREAGLMAMGGTLSGGVTTTNTVYIAAENNATLGGLALLDASGNIGVNVAAGNNNLQRNSLAIASATGGAQ